ncbi:hemerythrin domain-containing protein [Agromyces sp. NPDC058104]|uniref:hemerythrin domain-containing protein n=1 Tax=Agromyces sp. NPDC058104 TaxID=3346342 RepID=UPI0036DCAFCF
MTRRLPSTGGDDRVVDETGCDTSDIFIIHRIFRWGYRELPRLVRAVPAGDLERATTVGNAVELVDRGLHVHHEGEDELLWDRLERREPGCAMHVDVMKAQHARVSELLDVADGLLAEWRTTADPATGERLAAALDDVGTTLGVHLGREEADIVPVAARVLSQAEWEELGEHGRGALPKEAMPVQLGLMIDAVPEGEREEWLRANLPAPVRLLWALLMRRKYTAWHRALFPEGMPALV